MRLTLLLRPLLLLPLLPYFLALEPPAMNNAFATIFTILTEIASATGSFTKLTGNALETSFKNLIVNALGKGFTYLTEKPLMVADFVYFTIIALVGFTYLIRSRSTFSCFAGNTNTPSNLTPNVDALGRALAELRALSENVGREVHKAEENPKMQRTEAVNLWFEKIKQVEEVAQLLKDRDEEVDTLLEELTTLKGQGEAFKEVAEEVTAPAREELIDQRKIVGQKSTLDQVWRCLGEEKYGTVGLFGMPGVGKTTLLKQINNRLCKERLGFQVIIMVVVSSTPNIHSIREEIAKRVGLSDDKSWEYKRPEDKAKDLYLTLSKKKFMLLLDDIWQRIELTELGVPLPCLKSGSKILFTTRKSDVCSKMEADKIFRVQCLNSNEASELFQQKVGKATLNSDSQLVNLADKVRKKCDGLPLALITVGKVMAGKDTPSEWERAFEVLTSSAAEFEDMEKKVFSRLKFSYDRLSDDTTRSCLLYCSLYPQDYAISMTDLIDCWIGEGLLSEYSEGYVIISNLVQTSLLEKEDEDKVKMHDVIRDMALWIACGCEREKENCLVEAGIGLTEAPEVGKWEGIKRMSLMNNQIRSLPTIGAHLDLRTLFLNDNLFFRISSDFFQYLPFLKVLDLSKANYLLEVPLGISKLASLQHLDLSYTRISKLPKELRALANLKCLKLENATELCTVPRKLISEFKQLQVFRLTNCCVFGGASKTSVLSRGFLPLVDELCGLKFLQALSIELRNFKAFQRFSSLESLKSCTQTLHLKNFRNLTPLDVLFLKNMKNLRELYIDNCESEELKIDCANIVSIKTQGFHSLRTVRIMNCENLRNLTWLILAPNLKTLEIEGCSFLEEIISDEKLSEVQKKTGILNPFAKLQRLVLRRLPILKIISQNALPFPHLEHLTVRNCPNLTST